MIPNSPAEQVDCSLDSSSQTAVSLSTPAPQSPQQRIRRCPKPTKLKPRPEKPKLETPAEKAQLIDRSITQYSERKPKKDPEPLDCRFHHQWKQELGRAMKPSDEIELEPDSESNTTIWVDDLVTHGFDQRGPSTNVNGTS